MKLIIQIPCYNEEDNIETTIKGLPSKIQEIEKIEYLVINDGSTDSTLQKLKELPINYIINLNTRCGLAKAFSIGIENCLKNGADIIVNTDGDNQYSGKDIERLVKPIILNKADIVIGQRDLTQFSFVKRFFQKLGSFIVRICSKNNVKDAPSGFRAYSRDAAMKLNVFNDFTYTLETIIQAGANKLVILNEKIKPNVNTRKSRLFKNIFQYILKSAFLIIKTFIIYKPTTFFLLLGVIPFLSGIILLILNNTLKIFILGIGLLLLGLIIWTMSLFAVLYTTNRKLLENIQYKVRKMEYDK